jgi:hypothetical protein
LQPPQQDGAFLAEKMVNNSSSPSDLSLQHDRQRRFCRRERSSDARSRPERVVPVHTTLCLAVLGCV